MRSTSFFFVCFLGNRVISLHTSPSLLSSHLLHLLPMQIFSFSRANNSLWGFTLIELMIVIAIIGILGTALFPRVSQYISRSHDAARSVDHGVIVNWLTTYYVDNEQYPLSDNGCMTTNVLTGMYLTRLPKSPSGNSVDEGCGANGWYGYGAYFLHFLLMARMENQFTGNYTGSTEGFTGLLSDYAIQRVSTGLTRWAGNILVSYSSAWSNASWILIPPADAGSYPINGMCSVSPWSCVHGDPSLDNNQVACGTTRTWDCVGRYGGSIASCTYNNPVCPTYSVSWSFAANGSGATVRVCGVDVTANASGDFSRSGISSGTACNDIAATRAGYSCTTTSNWPASITSNTTGLGGTCSNPLASCTAAWQTYNATTTYPWCDTADKIVCTGNNAWFIWAMCNVWANIAGLTSASYGDMFQWWRNKAFPSTGSVPTLGGPIALSSLAAADAANQFITSTVSPWDWLTPQDNNRWWGATNPYSVTYQTAAPSDQVKMQWPCATDYHVPTYLENCTSLNSLGTSGCGYVWTTVPQTILKMPLAGYRMHSDGSLYGQGLGGNWWLSSPVSTSYFNASWDTGGTGGGNNPGVYGFSVRCVRN